LAGFLSDAERTADDIAAEVAKTGIGGLLPKREGDALADLLADQEPEVIAAAADVVSEADGCADDMPDVDVLHDLVAESLPERIHPAAMPLAAVLPDAVMMAGRNGVLVEILEPVAPTPDEREADTQSPPDRKRHPALSATISPSEENPGQSFGSLTAPQPSVLALDRPRFRMAIFGDFSGRAARGKFEIGDALASRRGIALDIDTVEQVIEGFATTLVLPIGPDGAGLEVSLGSLEDMHPDELVENLEIFEALKALRARLSNASTAAAAVREMQGWGVEFPTSATATRGHSAATSIPADKKLSDFQRLIGDTTGRLSRTSPIDDLLGQIIGPHIVPGPNPAAETLIRSVDAAMSSAMRLVLHHPEFQALESQWRSLDLLARRIETDATLTITLFDVSAEEIAADVAAADDLSQSGLFRLLNAPLQDEGENGFSALFGMYSFEETPPHAALLARFAKIAAHVQAPFFTAMTLGFMETELKDRHPLTAAAWDRLRAEPAAGYLGLASPRFMLRRPYGPKTDPIDAFVFEEFTQAEGLKGMLWANPVVLVAILLARTWKEGGPKMELGSVLSLDDVPFHFVTDAQGDQIALPCTERNLTEARVQRVIGRGFMPVVSIRGRDVVRLGSFQSLAGTPVAGPWSGPNMVRHAPGASPLDVSVTMKMDWAPAASRPSGDGENELESLLANFGDTAASTDPTAVDPALAALLEEL
ncbi:type VI secretion system contractile sheath large subunit, partial [Pseudorhodobacter sp.]|uniref:type VI secretion system contractile sheath domain-containing protein n=1 Tax=Pseudorhodobacter sp. TaxID=1934400 RepID=UPI002649237F